MLISLIQYNKFQVKATGNALRALTRVQFEIINIPRISGGSVTGTKTKVTRGIFNHIKIPAIKWSNTNY